MAKSLQVSKSGTDSKNMVRKQVFFIFTKTISGTLPVLPGFFKAPLVGLGNWQSITGLPCMKTHIYTYIQPIIRIGWANLCLLLIAFTCSQAQVRIVVTDYPPLPLAAKGLYLASSVNNWSPGDPAYEMKHNSDGHFYIDIPDSITNFKFKFTQGSWTVTEGDAKGSSIADRVYSRDSLENPSYLECRIAGWESKITYRFHILSVPENTPHDATLYLAGDFNGWNPADESYKLTRQMDGTYRVSVFTDQPVIHFKFTRGSWASVEGQGNGAVRPNRVQGLGRVDSYDNIPIEIESWEDLSATFSFYSLYDLLLLFSAFQCLLLVFAIPTIQDYNKSANRWLVLLLLGVAVALTIRVVGQFKEVAGGSPRLLFLPDFLWFGYAPVFYFYVEKLLFNSVRLARRWLLSFVPLGLHLLSYTPFFLMKGDEVKIMLLNQEPVFIQVFLIAGGFAFAFNLYYWLEIWREINHYRAQARSSFSYEENLSFLSTVMFIKGACLVIWFLAFPIFIYGFFTGNETDNLLSGINDVIWLIFSVIPYFLGYFAIHQPEVFKLPKRAIESRFVMDASLDEIRVEEIRELKEESSDEVIRQVQEQLDGFMEKEKPFTNPKLTLNELAHSLQVQPHLLSRVINEGYHKNFFDFINSYRVEEFKHRLEDPHYRHYTLLSIAFEVGFNSKTAFNRAFKKLTNTSPSEYVSNTQAGMESGA